MRLQPTAMFGIFIGTTRCYRTGPAGWPFPHISNCYYGELSPYLLNAPVVTLSLAVLLIFNVTKRCYRKGPAGWPFPHISNCYYGELSPYLLNAPVVTLSLAVLLIF